nr:MAG TPA: hypothetical protein [Bacteriophage sp.]DAI42620.1 MAG TPA: hypothetical protein [Caudoviricetes sp.]DAI42904.1 MAG TPA: hypothetical protein [Caudoviricetes sp.]DAP48998.1 MAG TPA: hypothetical protein [Caudoviricetes sp.]DAQ37083.1 MAG TPA: hypothetical protein [Caudoviricetes sp.]
MARLYLIHKKLSIMQCMPPFQNGKRYPHLFLTTW